LQMVIVAKSSSHLLFLASDGAERYQFGNTNDPHHDALRSPLLLYSPVVGLRSHPGLESGFRVGRDTAPGALAVEKTVSSYDAGPFLQYLELRSIHRMVPTAKI
jgi:hypothetical protein